MDLCALARKKIANHQQWICYKKLRVTDGRWLRTESLREKDHTEPHLLTERYTVMILMQITDDNFRIHAFILEYFYD